MPHPYLSKWKREIESRKSSERTQAWEEVCAATSQLDRDELAELLGLLSRETDSLEVEETQFQINSILRFLGTRPWYSEPQTGLPSKPEQNQQTEMEEWFFEPFRPRFKVSQVSNPCACIAICDKEHLRDVQAQLVLARRLASNRFPDTRFYPVPLQNPDWADVGIDQINTLCVIGRPSMFARCPILEQLAIQRPNTRFLLPDDDATWRSSPLTAESANRFHHVVQRRMLNEGGALPFRASDQDSAPGGNRRTDYAIVQRFRIKSNRRDVTVIIIAGATSLGTVGAAEWVANGQCDEQLRVACERLGKVMRKDTEMEALLKVTAEVRIPARPWRPLERDVIKLFLDDSVNAIADSVGRLTVVSRIGQPDEIFLDEDEARFRGSKSFDVIAAVCKAICRLKLGDRSLVPYVDLAADTDVRVALGLWVPANPGSRGLDPGYLGTFKTRLRDHLQGANRLGKAVTIGPDALGFSCQVDHLTLT